MKYEKYFLNEKLKAIKRIKNNYIIRNHLKQKKIKNLGIL